MSLTKVNVCAAIPGNVMERPPQRLVQRRDIQLHWARECSRMVDELVDLLEGVGIKVQTDRDVSRGSALMLVVSSGTKFESLHEVILRAFMARNPMIVIKLGAITFAATAQYVLNGALVVDASNGMTQELREDLVDAARNAGLVEDEPAPIRPLP